ncbi:RidA family protein [Paenibacillus pasadenensis]|uniref:RidA family protein n=1 Tax=Paenibacillus pasadenensis TaxID=217090 RepID=UPI00203E7338|nr:RidA family protein [Paenibacillus pasadenensis]MCM3749670.1 RidA family protein [Paenibacillus pasadenensis]
MKISLKKWVPALLVASCFVGASVYAAGSDKPNKLPLEPVHEAEFYGSPSSSISSAVAIPEGAATFHTSGTVPPMLNKEGKTLYERYGDTKTQGIGILKEIEKQLKEQGLTMKDVVYLRVYLVADPAKDNKIDYTGWFDAYAQFFNTKTNPVKTARSTVGVAGLVNSDWLIEIEAVAVYPQLHNQD